MCEVEFWEVFFTNESTRIFKVISLTLVDCRIADLESFFSDFYLFAKLLMCLAANSGSTGHEAPILSDAHSHDVFIDSGIVQQMLL